MPTKPLHFPGCISLVATAALAALAAPAQAQTDDSAPFYAGGSLGVTHVTNIYHEANAANSDTVVSAGLLGGINEHLGRQHVTIDGSLQNNRYSTNSSLNYRSHSLRGALDWETVGDLSGVLGVKSERTLADFNLGNAVNANRQKSIDSNDEYEAIARLGMGARYTLEGGWTHRRRAFSAAPYERFAYQQGTSSLGLYATPGGNVKLGLVGRHTKGTNPRIPVGITLDPDTLQFKLVTEANDYTRNDLDFTTNWTLGGRTSLNTRISRSSNKNSLHEQLRDFSGTTGAVGLNWMPTGKLQVNLQYARDTGQESVVRAADINRIYTSWQLGSSYAATGKLSFNANASSSHGRRSIDSTVLGSDSSDDTKTYNLGVRWAFSRAFSLGCQYDHASRNGSVQQYIYSANSYGCTGQAILY